jgi:hypothetical protein
MKKIILVFVLILVVVCGVVAGVFLVRQRQEPRKKASTPTGASTVRMSPSSGTFTVGEEIPVTVYFNPSGESISGVAVRLTYPYSGISPEIIASEPVASSTLLSSGEWSCPVRTVSTTGIGEVQIDISCVNSSSAGFSSTTDVALATFSLSPSEVPYDNPLTVSFDTTLSVITQKDSGADILLTPSGTSVFTISQALAEGSPSPSASPTESPQASPSSSPTASPTSPTPSSTATATPTSSPTSTPSASSSPVSTPPPVPVSGISLPTSLGVALGMLLLGVSLFLAI